MLNKSLTAIGFRHHQLNEEELSENRAQRRLESYIESIIWSPSDASSYMLTEGMCIDYREVISLALAQNPHQVFRVYPESNPRYCLPGSMFLALEDNNELALACQKILAPSWRLPLVVDKVKLHTDSLKMLNITYTLLPQVNQLFDIFPKMYNLLRPGVTYSHPIAYASIHWEYYAQGNIYLTLSSLFH